MLQFIQYELMKKHYRKVYGEKPSSGVVAGIGAIAGGVSALITTPIGRLIIYALLSVIIMDICLLCGNLCH